MEEHQWACDAQGWLGYPMARWQQSGIHVVPTVLSIMSFLVLSPLNTHQLHSGTAEKTYT